MPLTSKPSVAILIAVSVVLGACGGSDPAPGGPPPAEDSEDSGY